ncbi:hypothetical protein GCM10027053_21230 [Intrasporangium mesophilum]
MYWVAVLLLDVPPGVVTVTGTVPAVPAGEVTVSWVGLVTVRVVPVAVPNLTLVAPVRLVPVIVTTVPPVVGPPFGETALTVGAAGAGVV